jgi:hypothetical protein
MHRRWPLFALKLVLRLAAAGFITWTAWHVVRGWTGLPASVPIGAVVQAGAAVLAANFLLAAAWHLLLERVTLRRFAWPTQLRVFMASNLGRYVPGKVALPAVRIAALGPLGVGPALVGSAMFVELLSWITSAGVLAFSALSFGPSAFVASAAGLPERLGVLTSAGLACGFALLTLVLVSVDRRRLPALLLRQSRLPGGGPLLPARVALVHALYWASWWLHGVLLLSGFGASLSTASSAGAAFILGPVLGFLALIAPAGVGVKEAVVIALVAPVCGVSNAVAIGVLSRLLQLGADVFGWLLSLLIQRCMGAQGVTSGAT